MQLPQQHVEITDQLAGRLDLQSRSALVRYLLEAASFALSSDSSSA
jgi:hypothetical protein